MAELTRGAIAPLFDRLTGFSAKEGRHSSPSEVEASIARELARLFNTRSGLTLDAYINNELTVIDYGVPDFGGLSPSSQTDIHCLQSVIAKAVQCFEPRLHGVTVQVLAGQIRKPVAVAISGSVTIRMKSIPLSFNLQLDQNSGGLSKAAKS